MAWRQTGNRKLHKPMMSFSPKAYTLLIFTLFSDHIVNMWKSLVKIDTIQTAKLTNIKWMTKLEFSSSNVNGKHPTEILCLPCHYSICLWQQEFNSSVFLFEGNFTIPEPNVIVCCEIRFHYPIDDLMKDCGIFLVNALERTWPCTKPYIYIYIYICLPPWYVCNGCIRCWVHWCIVALHGPLFR